MSPVFEAMIKMTSDSPGPALLVLDRDVDFQDLQSLVEYIYTGNTVVQSDRMDRFLQLGYRFQVAGFSSAPPTEQSHQEPGNESEIAGTVSNIIIASQFAGTPSRKPVIEPESPAVASESPEVKKKPVPRVTAPANVRKSRNRPPSAENQFVCEFCNKPYTSRKSVKLHQTRACGQNPNLRLYTCSICNATVKPNMKYNHIKKHTNEKNKASTSKRESE